MTVNISTTAEIDSVRLTQQGSHPSSPSSGYESLYVISGSPHGGLFVKDSSGRQIGPFITGSPAAGAGTVLKTVWSPDAPPSSAGAADDEFQDGSGGVPGGWTEFDPDSNLLVDESSTYKCLIVTGSSANPYGLVGIYKDLPAGDFTIWTKFEILSKYANYFQTGLALWEDPSNTTKKIMTTSLVTQASSQNQFVSYPYSNYQSQGAASFAIDQWGAMFGYLRLRRIGSNYFHGYSQDGFHWGEYTSAVNPDAFTPTKMGLYLTNNNTSSTYVVAYTFFRYLAYDIGVNGAVPGRAVSLYA